MPVLVNTGDHPVMAAWLFYSRRGQLEELRDAIREGGYSAGVVDADPQGKPREATDVFLVMAREGQDAAGGAQGAGEQGADEQGAPTPTPAADGGQDAPAPDAGDSPAGLTDADPDARLAAKGARRVMLGTTTCEAARRYLQPREVPEGEGESRGLGLPGLPQLADFIDELLGQTPDLHWAVWSLDQQGVLRMAPARELKTMSGNILKVKL